MYKGSIVEKGPPDEMMNNPQDSYTKRLREDIPLLYGKWDGF
jgi:ABC-type dipeptide/oligopeptide/nickel transport system ATPase component